MPVQTSDLNDGIVILFVIVTFFHFECDSEQVDHTATNMQAMKTCDHEED